MREDTGGAIGTALLLATLAMLATGKAAKESVAGTTAIAGKAKKALPAITSAVVAIGKRVRPMRVMAAEAALAHQKALALLPF